MGPPHWGRAPGRLGCERVVVGRGFGLARRASMPLETPSAILGIGVPSPGHVFIRLDWSKAIFLETLTRFEALVVVSVFYVYSLHSPQRRSQQVRLRQNSGSAGFLRWLPREAG